MKSIAKIVLALGLIAPVALLANERAIVAGDDTVYSKLCATAVSNPSAFERQLRQLRISEGALVCNGQNVSDFVDTMTDRNSAVALRAGRSNLETEICVAAATSAERFQTLKDQVNERVLGAISCNDMPLAEFAREFGNADIRI